MPHLKSLVERHSSEEFAILGINTDGDKDEYRSKKEDFGVTWRSAWEGGGDGEIVTRWAIQGFPTKFLLDAKGVIRFTGNQLHGEKRLEAAIKKLLAEAKK